MAQVMIYIDEELDEMLKEYEDGEDIHKRPVLAGLIADKVIEKWKSLEDLNERENN